MLAVLAFHTTRGSGGTGARTGGRARMDDRDNSGYPDWMEDRRYADEAPGRRHRRPGGYSGCTTVLPLLLATAAAASALLRRLRGA
jgi:hypothetical protein